MLCDGGEVKDIKHFILECEEQDGWQQDCGSRSAGEGIYVCYSYEVDVQVVGYTQVVVKTDPTPPSYLDTGAPFFPSVQAPS